MCGKKAGLTTSNSDILAIVINPWYIAELSALFLQACSWVMALRCFPLSFAYPFMSLVFGLNLLSAWLLFGESLRLNHILGMLIIIAGVLEISRSAAKVTKGQRK